MKTRETGPDRFHWFLKNRPVKFEIFKNLKKFEIKNSKKTRVHFKIFCQNGSKKIEVLRARKFTEVKNSKITRFSQKSLDFLENRAVILKIGELILS
jgi:hypothetical protein